MTDWQQPVSFEEWWPRFGLPYVEAVLANDATPWAEDDDRRRPLIDVLDVPADVPPLELRRRLWRRRHTRPAPPTGLHRDPRRPENYVVH